MRLDDSRRRLLGRVLRVALAQPPRLHPRHVASLVGLDDGCLLRSQSVVRVPLRCELPPLVPCHAAALVRLYDGRRLLAPGLLSARIRSAQPPRLHPRHMAALVSLDDDGAPLLELAPHAPPQQPATEVGLDEGGCPLAHPHLLRLAPPHQSPQRALHHYNLEELEALDACVVQPRHVLHRMHLADATAQLGGIWLELLACGRHEHRWLALARRLDQQCALPLALVPDHQRRAALEPAQSADVAGVQRHQGAPREAGVHRPRHPPCLEHAGGDAHAWVGAVVVGDLVHDARQPIAQAREHDGTLSETG